MGTSPRFDVDTGLRDPYSPDFLPHVEKPLKAKKPPKAEPCNARDRLSFAHICPYCEQRLPNRSTNNLLAMFTSGIRQLVIAVLTIVFATFRFARFGVAGSLCLVGFVGGCCSALGMRIADPGDRKLLEKRWNASRVVDFEFLEFSGAVGHDADDRMGRGRVHDQTSGGRAWRMSVISSAFVFLVLSLLRRHGIPPAGWIFQQVSVVSASDAQSKGI